MYQNLLNAVQESLFLILGSAFLTLVIGLPLGLFFAMTGPKQLLANKWIYGILNTILRLTASVPYIMVMIAFIAFMRWLLNQPLTPSAALFPLILAAIPSFALSTAEAIESQSLGFHETMLSFGATPFQILHKVLLPESFPKIIQAFTKTVIQLVGYSTIAGALGSGGLGELAIRKGLQNFNSEYLIAIVLILLALILIIQYLGYILTFGFSRKSFIKAWHF